MLNIPLGLCYVNIHINEVEKYFLTGIKPTKYHYSVVPLLLFHAELALLWVVRKRDNGQYCRPHTSCEHVHGLWRLMRYQRT